jgi:hypothetical protein
LAVRINTAVSSGSELVASIKDAAKGERRCGTSAGPPPKQAVSKRAARPWFKSTAPLLIGSSCGYLRNDLVMAGTLWVLRAPQIRRARPDSSNNHVLADEGRYRKGGPIVQPGALDGGDPSRTGLRSSSFVQFQSQPKDNYVDAAVAAIDAGIEFEPAGCAVSGPSGFRVPAARRSRRSP